MSTVQQQIVQAITNALPHAAAAKLKEVYIQWSVDVSFHQPGHAGQVPLDLGIAFGTCAVIVLCAYLGYGFVVRQERRHRP